jgi:NADH:ubiquinone oxidoreductase subunit 2 (subunit N)
MPPPFGVLGINTIYFPAIEINVLSAAPFWPLSSLMSLLIFFDGVFFNILTFSLGFYLLSLFCFSLTFFTAISFDMPPLLHCFNIFSFCFLALTFHFFCFDFFDFDFLFFFNQHFELFFIFSSLFVVLLSRDFFVAQLIIKFEYDIFFLFCILSAVVLCFCDNLLIFYLILELQSLTFYVLASFYRTSEFAVEAGLKYFIFGAFISCFLLLGICIIYFSFGCVSFELLFSIIIFSFNFNEFFGVFFILFVLLFKIGAAPFHF